MHQSLYQRFISAEQQFLSAFADGPQALAVFDDAWIALFADFSSAMKLRRIDEQTKAVAHATASRVAIIADHLLSLNIEAPKLCDSLRSRCVDIICQATDDCDAQSEGPHSPSSAPSSSARSRSDCNDIPSDQKNSTIDFVCRHWLVQNLHNPYPCNSTKDSLAQLGGGSVKDVQEWFADARRHIGWTALCQEKFGGSRRATVDAASCAYMEQDTQQDLPGDIRRAFAAIKTNASRIVDHPPTPADNWCIAQEQVSHVSSSRDITADGGFTTSFSQESPNHFLDSFATRGSLPDDEEVEDTTPPPPIAGSKRRFEASSGASDGGIDLALLSVEQHSKRARYSHSTSEPEVHVPRLHASNQVSEMAGTTQLNIIDTFHGLTDIGISFTSLYPRSASSSMVAEANNSGDVATTSTAVPASLTSISRKRRFSDTDSTVSPKRPRGLTAGPRKQTVSDPIPMNLSPNALEMLGMDAWLLGNSDIPRAMDARELDPSLFSDEGLAISATTSSQNGASPGSIGSSSPSQLDVSDADLLAATADGFDLSAYDSSPLSAWDASLLDSDSNVSGNSSAQSPSSASCLSELTDFGLSYPTNGNWTQDWSQFVNILDSLGASPTSSQSPLQDFSFAAQSRPKPTSLMSTGDMNDTQFDLNPSSSSSDLLSDIGGFSSLHMPLEATF